LPILGTLALILQKMPIDSQTSKSRWGIKVDVPGNAEWGQVSTINKFAGFRDFRTGEIQTQLRAPLSKEVSAAVDSKRSRLYI